jgi:hypothetical protein
MPSRLTDTQLETVKATAAGLLPPLPACDPTVFAQFIRTLQSALPMRATDETAGKLLAATYHRMLGDQPREALAFMVETALATCRWFPTIAECLDILREWSRCDDACQAKRLAKRMADGEAANRLWDSRGSLEAFIDKLEEGKGSQADLDAAPRWWLEIAEARGAIRRRDGAFVLRPATVGMDWADEAAA